MRRHQLNHVDQLMNWLQDASNQHQRLSELVDRMSTNHTYFWREPDHFLWLEQQLEDLERRHSADRKIRIWCAASSRGHEPYTLAAVLRMHFGSRYAQWDAGLLATDISREALDFAERGIYEEEEIDVLPQKYRGAMFQKSSEPGLWSIRPELKKDVTYRRFNLMNPLPFKSKFDMVFCRNVMIYFDHPTKKALVERIHAHLQTPGWLVISLSESIDRNSGLFHFERPGIYKRDH
jgi:chemotaxis protein methyltransferase CheR